MKDRDFELVNCQNIDYIIVAGKQSQGSFLFVFI
jgi:hypothetical protein